MVITWDKQPIRDALSEGKVHVKEKAYYEPTLDVPKQIIWSKIRKTKIQANSEPNIQEDVLAI